MEKSLKLNDVAKETLVVLNNFEKELFVKIPNSFMNFLKELSLNSKKNYKIDKTKSLEKQKISEETKDLVSYIYYNYIAKEDEKKNILKTWDKNEIEYIKQLHEKYNYDDLFKRNYGFNNTKSNKNLKIKKEIISDNNQIVEYKENNIINRFKKFLSKLFNKKN